MKTIVVGVSHGSQSKHVVNYARNVESETVEGIERYIDLSKSDCVATLHRQRSLWSNLFQKSIPRSISEDTDLPMFIFQQY